MSRKRWWAVLLSLLVSAGCTTTTGGTAVGSTPVVERAEAYTGPATDLPEPEKDFTRPTGSVPIPSGPEVRWAWSTPLPFGWSSDSPIAGFDTLLLGGTTCGIALNTQRFESPPAITDAFDQIFESLPTVLGYSRHDDALDIAPADPLWLPVTDSELTLVLTGRRFEVDNAVGTIHVLISGGTMLSVQAMCEDNIDDLFEEEVVPTLQSLAIHQL